MMSNKPQSLDVKDAVPCESEQPGSILFPAEGEERQAFEEILSLLFERWGVDFSHYRQTTVIRRFSRRMALCKKNSYRAYLDYVREVDEELSLLHQDLLLYFTEFFRDPAVFNLLKTDIFPSLVRNRTVKTPLRVWVPGCSTGEEVYSLAIALFEFLEAQNLEVHVQFFGTDLVDKHIIKARAATYGEKIEQHVSAERLERFFDKTAKGYRVIKRIREMCVFAVQDITQDPPFPNIDLLSCRNLLIYLDATYLDMVIPLFHFSLNEDGCLLLGTSETLGRFSEYFLPIDAHCNIFKKRVNTNKPPYKFPSGSSLFSQKIRGQAGLPGKSKFSSVSDLGSRVDQLLLENYAPPGVVIDSHLQIRQFRGRTSQFLEPSTGEASLKLSRMTDNSLMPDLYVAVEEAKRDKKAVRKSNIPHIRDGEHYLVDLSVLPVPGDLEGELYYLVLFEQQKHEAGTNLSGMDITEEPQNGSVLENAHFNLRRELLATKEYLQTIIEEKDEVNQELWTANEEVQSTNEELQSVNEELEAAKEELESSNEELIALNEELYLKNTELTEVNFLNEVTINSSMDGILTFDNDFKIKMWNPAMEQMWGCSRKMCLDKSLFELFPFLVTNGHQDVLHSVLKGQSAIVENQAYSNLLDNKEGFFEARYSPLRDHNDKIIGGLAVIHDSTVRKMAEEKLMESEERFKMVVHQSPVAIEMYNPQGILININRAAERLLMMNGETMIKTFNIFESGIAENSVLMEHIKMACNGIPTKTVEYWLAGARPGSAGQINSDCWVVSRIYPLTDSSGKVMSIVMSHEDVTAGRQQENDKLKIQKLESIGTLAGGIAHDFNNILMGLIGNITIARSELERSHPAWEHLVDAEKSMNRATRLTQQLLIFAKGGSPVREGVSLGTLIKEVVRFDLTGSNIKPFFEIAEDLWVAEVDRGQVQQVFSNITINARQAMESGGNFYVSLTNTEVANGEIAELLGGRYVQATFRDEGVGIDHESLNQVFDPYFSTKRVGRGLGLATSYSIIKKHGGCITVHSSPGRGTTFTVYLPVGQTNDATSDAGHPLLDAIMKETGIKVLVMDDEAMICKVTRRFLEKDGYTVETVEDGANAIERYRQAQEDGTPFQLVLMDLTIPGGMGGREAVSRVLELDKEARVIVSSGYADDPVMSDYRKYGFKGVVPKPYTREKLLQVVQRVLTDG